MTNMHLRNASLPLLPPRRADAHKGDFGLALIVGGSRGMAGAAALAGRAALRGGAGLVRVAVPDAVLDTVAGFEPSYMTVGLPDAAGRLSAAAFHSLAELATAATAVACGPGLGRSFDIDQLVIRLYQEIARPMVFDADALNALASEPEVLANPGGPRVLTPHPGEFARLVGRKLEPDARRDAAVELAARCGVVVALKSHDTLVTDGRRRETNATGNPGMATGGSGDVLTGVITALLCQRLEAFDAARLGVYVHGLAGDLAAARLGQVSLIASDLIEYLPQAFLQYGSAAQP